MTWLDKLERKMGKFKIPNLMLYIVIGNLMVYIFDILFLAKGMQPFDGYLAFIPSLIANGQIWRVLTFVLVPPSTSPVLLLFTLYFYYFIGTSLESAWGAFRFTFYYVVGMIGSIIAGLITGYATAFYLNMSLFFAFAVLYPNQKVLLFFFIPIKIKYLGLIDAAFFVYSIFTAPFFGKIAAIMAIVNFLIFFGPSFVSTLRMQIKQKKARMDFQKKMNQSWRH